MFHAKMSLGLAAAALFAMNGCSRAPLPDGNSAAARLYGERCGGCHRLYDPRSLTAAMWRIQVAAMMPKIAEAGQEPLSASDQAVILSYLERNAGQQ